MYSIESFGREYILTKYIKLLSKSMEKRRKNYTYEGITQRDSHRWRHIGSKRRSW
jgi:hypothetical protein